MEPRSVGPSQPYLEGAKVQIDDSYGGLGALFLDALFANSNRISQIDAVTGVSESSGSVRARAIQTAHELLHFGLVENDVVLVCSRCHADQTVVVLACLLVGCIVAPIDSELHQRECAELVGQLKPKACFCDLRSLKQIERVVEEIGLISRLVHFGEVRADAASFRKLTMNRQHPERFEPVTIRNPRKRCAFVLPTQGVEGPPKLVCLSHHFIYSQICLLLAIMNAPERIISYYPLTSVLQVVLMCLCLKTPVVRILTGSFVERTTAKLIHDFGVDYAFLNTELALSFLEHISLKDFNVSCLKCILIGSVNTTPSDVIRLVSLLPQCKFVQLYFTTETGIAISSATEDYGEYLERTGTVGKVMRNFQLRVVDIDTRRDVDPGMCGELLIAGDCLMLGYFKNITYTKSCTQDGYFKTGDIAQYAPGGWVFVEGRIVDLMKVKGFEESPRELENTIMMHPLVRDAAVIGNDKEVVACVVPKADTHLEEAKLMTFISDRLPFNKWPTRIVFRTEFPTTPLGKVKRDVLRTEIFSVRIERSQTFLMADHVRHDDDK